MNDHENIAMRVMQALAQLERPDLTAEEKCWRDALAWALTGEPAGFGMRPLNLEIRRGPTLRVVGAPGSPAVPDRAHDDIPDELEGRAP